MYTGVDMVNSDVNRSKQANRQTGVNKINPIITGG
jgi:hypothetical protein